MKKSILSCLLVSVFLMLPTTVSGQRVQVLSGDVKVSSIGPKISPIDTAIATHPATKKCGTAFRCKQGWDIAVLEVKTAPVVQAEEVAYVRALVMNLGSVPSPEVPAQTALGATSKRWTVPVLGPNDSLEVTVPVKVPRDARGGNVILDPDKVTGDKFAENNLKEFSLIVEKAPKVEFAEFAPQESAVKQGQPIIFSFTLRNTSRAYVVRDAVLSVKVYKDNNIDLPTGDIIVRLPMPELGPQSEIAGTFTIVGATRRKGRLASWETASAGAKVEFEGPEGRLTFRDIVTVNVRP